MVYFDYAANSPVDKEVLDVFYDTTLKYYANPNAIHKLGLEAKELLDTCTSSIAKNLNVLPEEIIYTSGATEANNLAIKGILQRYKNYGKHALISSLEHNSIVSSITFMQEEGFEFDLIPVNKEGIIDIEALKKLIRDDTILVSICSVDSELGIREPIEEIGKLLKQYPHLFFHTDASQAIGKTAISFSDVDLVTIAPHKFYGLNGTGLLIKKKNVSLKPMIHGGKSTTVYRSGTPVLAGVIALDKAIDLALKNMSKRLEYVHDLNNQILKFLNQFSSISINSPKSEYPYIINFSIKGVKSIKFAKMLEQHEIYLSPKTSCCPIETPSKLVYALTHDKSLASTSLRLSLSHLTTKEDLEEFFRVFTLCYKELEENGKI